MPQVASPHIAPALDLLKRLGYLAAGWTAEPLAGDGSDRLFLRISRPAASSWIAVLPGTAAGRAQGLAEARSARLIGTHLHNKNVPVPRIIQADEQSGCIVFEDLGDTLLHDVAAIAPDSPETANLYLQAVEVLAHLQVSGRIDFNPEWCWDTPSYDKDLMLTRESGYFIKAFCENLLGLKGLSNRLPAEFQRLAADAARQPAGYFLHRDFQSRNLMVHKGRIRIIDFQGGRLGPLAYDLAALLIDPYTALPGALQNRLLDHYLDRLAERIPLDRQAFLQGYWPLALQRNLQILGAFAFLSNQKGKKFFATYLRPAALSLQEHLAKPAGYDYPELRKLADACLARLGALTG